MAEKREKKNVMLDTLTGDEFKQLIEQFTQDGKIDTLPELFRVLSDIPEDQTLGEYIAEHGGGTPTPDSVGMTELKDEVKDKLENIYVPETETLYINGAKPKDESENGDIDDSEAGYDAGAENGE